MSFPVQGQSTGWIPGLGTKICKPSSTTIPLKEKSRFPSSLGKLDQGTTLGSQSLWQPSSRSACKSAGCTPCLTVVTKPKTGAETRQERVSVLTQQPRASGTSRWGGALRCQAPATCVLSSLCPMQGPHRGPSAACSSSSHLLREEDSGGCSPPGPSLKAALPVISFRGWRVLWVRPRLAAARWETVLSVRMTR